jgi:hypothetical protein
MNLRLLDGRGSLLMTSAPQPHSQVFGAMPGCWPDTVSSNDCLSWLASTRTPSQRTYCNDSLPQTWSWHQGRNLTPIPGPSAYEAQGGVGYRKQRLAGSAGGLERIPFVSFCVLDCRIPDLSHEEQSIACRLSRVVGSLGGSTGTDLRRVGTSNGGVRSPSCLFQ